MRLHDLHYLFIIDCVNACAWVSLQPLSVQLEGLPVYLGNVEVPAQNNVFDAVIGLGDSQGIVEFSKRLCWGVGWPIEGANK